MSFSNHVLIILLLSHFTNSIYSLNLKNQTSEESQYLKYHICKDAGEAYAASYLVTKQYLIERKTDYNLTWVNCEMGSFIMMNQRPHMHGLGKPGTIIQSLDVLDFSVIHLSAYERLERRHAHRITQKLHSNTIQTIKSLSSYLELNVNKHKQYKLNSFYENRTVAIMPFIGTAMGAGHSNLLNRYEYLKACVWSIYEHFKHIVVAVTSEVDYNYARYLCILLLIVR
jgi:hypothetical protein